VQLKQYTDFGLRALIALALNPGERLTVTDISKAYGISRHHLMKVVVRLAELGYVETIRGKGGGVRLARPPGEIRIGTVVRQMEAELAVVECLKKPGGPCPIATACRLKGMLRAATREFIDSLDKHTLRDLLAERVPIARMLGLPAGIART
jgi:Rrf2 family transcriptional regulator, nitric oxide-sensitive transcriptional repressor